MINYNKASHLKRGDTQLINNLSKIQQDDLWEGVKHSNFLRYLIDVFFNSYSFLNNRKV